MNNVFKALSDPTRRQIIELLRKEDMSAGDIASHFDIAKPSISHHLNILKQAHLVLSEKQGQNIIYSINVTAFQDVLTFFFNMIGKEDNLDETK